MKLQRTPRAPHALRSLPRRDPGPPAVGLARLGPACAFAAAFVCGLCLAVSMYGVWHKGHDSKHDALALAGWRLPSSGQSTALGAAPPPAAPRDPHRRVALLHKARAGAVTLRALAAAAEARGQVEAAGGAYYLLYSTHPRRARGPGGLSAPRRVRERIELSQLRLALGDAAVFVIGSDDVAGALGEWLLEEQRRVVGEREWAWVTNDAVDVTW